MKEGITKTFSLKLLSCMKLGSKIVRNIENKNASA
jgi:hypothetical protein